MSFLLGLFTFTAFVAHCIITFIPIFILGLLKLYPSNRWRQLCTKMVEHVSSLWIWINNKSIEKLQNIHWDIDSDSIDLKKKSWNLVVANHQSWVDVVVLQKDFNYKIPMLKFFVKDTLKWVPLLGFAWWTLDCPFMKRYSRKYLEKHPEKQGKDLLATKKACLKFKNRPVSIMNFFEGTRFTDAKHKKQNSPYQFLLKPKAGGISQIINAMNDQVRSILDVTIIYPEHKKTFWDYLSGKIKTIKVSVRELTIPQKFLSADLTTNLQLQTAFREWLNERWHEKDRLIAHANPA
jgi:1-acyl-sn-glycerol-3-phosphate acyltransferase